MSGRLTAQMLVSALVRLVEAEGGFAMVLHKGDPIGGVILVQLLHHGTFAGLFERLTDLDGRQKLVPCGPQDKDQPTEIYEYISRRRRSDPDLWLVELDIAQGERFAAQILCGD